MTGRIAAGSFGTAEAARALPRPRTQTSDHVLEHEDAMPESDGHRESAAR